MKALLLILDGAGLAAPQPGNAVTAETMPVLFRAMAENGHAVLGASGKPVGQDDGQVGNSEVGHLTIGAGFVIPSTLSRIDDAFRNGDWDACGVWAGLKGSGRLHLIGLLSDAGVHGHMRSLVQAAELACRHGVADVVVHPVLDGVDSQAGTAPALIKALRSALAGLPRVRLGVVSGRKWFTDRSGDLDISAVFADGLAGTAGLPEFTGEALDAHLAKGSEASFPAHLAPGGVTVAAGEPVLLTQHRADRATQVARVISMRNPVYSLVELADAVPAGRIFFPTVPLTKGLAFELRQAGVSSTRIAEACKFPHVTRFINGLNTELEGRPVRVESIPDAQIPERPEMSIDQVAREIEAVVRDPSARVAIANIANLDQVGHLGRYDLAATAAQAVDRTLQRLLGLCREHGWTVLITSDHGNADRTQDEAGKPFGSHTERPVPFTVVPPPGLSFTWTRREGSLANVAPTLLNALGLSQPGYMEPSLIAMVAKA
ncbi:MAG: hypothetical protein H7Z12_07085 [Rhodospirillaceae bacterium]|nr:hypothetical protein [Rhodospirillales bacterium]